MKTGIIALISSIIISRALCVLFLASLSYAAEESLVLETYYPSPYGVYNELRLFPRGDNPSCSADGVMYFDNRVGQQGLKVCDGGIWRSATGYWAQAGSDLYPTNTAWNVGIGTASPGANKLDVAGTAQLRGAAGGTGLYVDSAGSVGIGTSAPSSPLHIANNIPTITVQDLDTVGVGSWGAVSFKDSMGTLTGYINKEGGTGRMVISNFAAAPIAFAYADTARMSILSNGNVGIGTTSPQRKVEISGGGIQNGAAIRFTGIPGNVENILLEAMNPAGTITAWSLGSRGANNQYFLISSAGAERLRMDMDLGTTILNSGGGNTQIGFLSAPPAPARLSVSGNVAIGAVSYITTAPPADGLIVSGNVGIGTANPSERLEVNGGNVKIGSDGTPFAKLLFGSFIRSVTVSAGSTISIFQTVTGLQIGAHVFANLAGGPSGLIITGAWVGSADTLYIALRNLTGSSITGNINVSYLAIK